MPEYNGQNYRFYYSYSYGLSGYFQVNPDYTESLAPLVDRESFYGQQELRMKQWADFKEAAKYAESFGLITYYRFIGYNEILFRSPFDQHDYPSSQHSRLCSFAQEVIPQGSIFRESFYAVMGYCVPDISESNPDLWAYYQTTTKAALAGSDGKGIKTLIKYGKLLKKLFPMATEAQITAEVENWKEEKAKANLLLEFVISTDSESFKLAYQGEQSPTLNPKLNWPYKSLQNSCMRYSTDNNWADCDGFHPAQAYASGDFAIVYATQAGRIAGRAVAPYDKDTGKLCGVSGPIYTTSDSASHGLRAYIESNGASFTDDSYGICKDWVNRKLKLCRIQLDNGGFLMPYVDAIDSCEDTGKALLLTDCGPISCRPTEGYTEAGSGCESCGYQIGEDYTYTDDNGGCCCESCYNERYFYCNRLGETVPVGETSLVWIASYSGRYYHERVSDQWREDNCTLAEDDDEWYLTDAIVWIEDSPYSPNFEDYGTCEVTQELFLSENLAYIESHGIQISLELLKSDKAWHCVNGQWQLKDGWTFCDSYGTAWEEIEFEDVDSELIESEYAIAAE